MKSSDLQKPESVEIPYDRETFEKIVEKLFRNSQYSDKKEKILSYLSKIERKINTIKQYQTTSYPKNFYSSMNDLLLKIKNLANEIYRKTNKYDPVLSNTLKELILNSIKPLGEALNEQLSKETFKTQRLYAQQSFVCRQSNLQEKLMQHLNNIKKFLKETSSVPPYCYISYAWPSEERKEEEYWVQPFLYVLYDHLAAAGIRVVMDIRDNEPGESIVAFTKKYNDGNYIILVGTESLLEKHHSGRSLVIQSESNIIQNRFKQDKRDFGRSRIYPLLISGTIETAYPERYQGYVTIRDPRESGYLKMLKDLTDWIYRFRLKRLDKDGEYADLWDVYFNSIPNLPNDNSAVKEEILQNYHKPRYIEELKQKKKKQKSNEVPEFESEIINVSGFNGCCGLFALALGVKIAMREKGANERNQLNFLDVIDEEALKSTTEDTKNIAKQLKEEMYWALLLDEAYKERRLHSFTDYCRAELENGVLAEDMSSFSEANQVYREELKALWLSAREAIEKQFEGGEDEYREYLKTNLNPLLINEFKEKLSELVISSPSEGEVKQFIDSYCEEEADLMGELIKLNRLYRSVWHEFEVGTAEQRNRLDELYTKILTEKSITLLEKEQGEVFITALLKLSFLQKTSFECNGELEKICDKKEIISTAIFLLVSVHIKKEWDRLYENYCKYIKENRTMLSADELGCLALRWKVQLRIQFGSGELYETHQKDELTLIRVILCNPSQNHWQIYHKNQNKPMKEVNSKNNEEELDQTKNEEKRSLSLAVQMEDEFGIMQLLEKKAVVDQANKHGWTPLMFAVQNGEQIVIAQLLEKEADVNHADERGCTPLMIAAQKGHQGVIAQLLEKGANVNQSLEDGTTSLIIAISNGHQAVVTQLLEKSANVNQALKDGTTPLMFAALNGYEAVVLQLLEKGADVNQSLKDGATPLMFAVQKGHEGVVAQLLEKEADVNQADKRGWTPLMIAAASRHQAVVAQLLEKGADVNQSTVNGVTPLYVAACNGHEGVVTQLLNGGAIVNQANKNGWTPLYIAAHNGHQDVVAQLLEKGADVNQSTVNGVTPLYIAACNGHEGVVTQLLKKGATVNQVNQYGATPLYIAALKRHESVLAQLLEKGADVNQANANGWAPLFVAAQNRYQGVVAQLLEKGADVNQSTVNGMTPLYIAACNGHEGVVTQLLKKGATVNQVNEYGVTPLYVAAQNGHEAVVAQLLNGGAIVNQANKNGWAPLYIAAHNGHQDVVAQLLEKGADVNQSTVNGVTPLYVAACNGHEGVVTQLLKKGANVNQVNQYGVTPLYVAARNGHETVVAQLLNGGAIVNQANKNGWTPLYIAAHNGHQDVVAQLLNNRANINQAEENGATPLYVAAQNGHRSVVAQLLDNGANANQTDEQRVAPLYIAAQGGYEGVVAELLKKGANVNQSEKDGRTPLYIAAANGHQAVVAQLLEKGANVNQANENGETPLAIATMRSHFKIAAVLLKAGAKIGNTQKEKIAFLYPHLREWLRWGEYEACLILSDYRLNQEPGVRIEERVIAYYAQGKLGKAFEYLEMLKKKKRQEDTAFIAYQSGYLKMEQGEFDLAIRHYEAALREDKNNGRVRYDRILAELYKTGDPKVILRKLEELPSPEPFQDKQDITYSYHIKGFIYHQCLQHEKALVCFNEALKCDEKDIFTLAKRGFLLLCQGIQEDGLKDLDTALAINPYYSGALARRGYGLALEGAFEEAREYFERSLQVNPSHFETLLLKGASLILQNFSKKAKECIEKTLAVSISRSLLIAQHMPQEVKEKIVDYTFDYSCKDKEKLKEVLLVLLQLRLFSEKTQEKVEFYLTNAYSEEELNVLLRAVSGNSPLYEVLCRAVLNNAKRHQIEKEQREAYFHTKQKELYYQLMQLTDENSLAIQKENIQKELEQLVKIKEPVDDLRNLLNQCVEPTELGRKYNALNLAWRWLTSREDFLISELGNRMQSIDYFIGEHSSPSYQNIRESLGIIRAIYDEYQKNLKDLVNNKELQGAEREKRLNELYAPRCQLSMALFRDRYLKKEVQSCLPPHAGETEEKTGQTVYGTHVVKQCGEVHFKYHDNTNPCYPVIECMIGTLYSLLAGMSYGTAPTEIVKLRHKGYERVLVASQTLKGINLFDFLTHYVEREPQLIYQFDSHNFSTMIITSLLSNPVDGKPDNYMVQFFKNEKNEEKIKVLGFDNDLAFGEPVVKIHQGKRAGQHFVEVRNVFYFFPQMNAPIDPTLCKRLIEASPELLILEFIRSLQKQDEYYKQLLKEGVLTLKEAEALQLPICFPREETLGIMYKRLRAIQRCLRKDSQLSHIELFYAIYPEMAKYYEKVASKNQAKPNAILENIAELYAASAPTLEEAEIILGQKSLVTMSRLAIKTIEKGESAKPHCSLLKGIEKFVESIQFSGISVERQCQILREIKSLSGIEQLTIRNCEGLDDKLLQVLMEDLPTLKRLNLVDCSQIKTQNLAMIVPRGRAINIQIVQEKPKKQESTPQFEQFLEQSGKSEKAAGKEKEIMGTKKISNYLKTKRL